MTRKMNLEELKEEMDKELFLHLNQEYSLVVLSEEARLCINFDKIDLLKAIREVRSRFLLRVDDLICWCQEKDAE
jgi:hypothetical protein